MSLNSFILHSLFISFLGNILDVLVLIYLRHVFYSFLVSLLWHVVNVLILIDLGHVFNLMLNWVIINFLNFSWNVLCRNNSIILDLAYFVGNILTSSFALDWLVLWFQDFGSSNELGLTWGYFWHSYCLLLSYNSWSNNLSLTISGEATYTISVRYGTSWREVYRTILRRIFSRWSQQIIYSFTVYWHFSWIKINKN